MKIPYFKQFFIAGITAVLSGCGSSVPAIVSTPIENIDEIPLKVEPLTEEQLKGWGSADLLTDTIPGMSIRKAYDEIIKNHEGETVIVGVIDSGIDIGHEDLEEVIWVNEDEVPGNGKDDDNNGYVDDIHGWNFLGDAVGMNLNFVRIYRDLKPKYENIPSSSIAPEDREEYELYKKAQEEYQKEYNEVLGLKNQYEGILQQVKLAHKAVSDKLGTDTYSTEELAAMEATTQEMQQYKGYLLRIMGSLPEDGSINDVIGQLEEGLEYYANRINTHFNLDLYGRRIVGDDPHDITDTDYGNNDVSGPDPQMEDAKHGTHVAGIIAANRENEIGIKGVANNVEIMALRAVPDGDEFDKDIALAIRYAVDNGADIINMSFGKYFSSHPQWVIDAIEYAAQNDVLIVKAAGNEGENLDLTTAYPNDQAEDDISQYTDNFLTVGALTPNYGSNLLASYSNYGDQDVDVFAPGSQIWSTTPNDEYEFLQGTSMAAPAVTGVAAVIRSFYPKLSAEQVKQIIMESGLRPQAVVMVGGDSTNTQQLSEISTSGSIVNLYNALILADKISKQ